MTSEIGVWAFQKKEIKKKINKLEDICRRRLFFSDNNRAVQYLSSREYQERYHKAKLQLKKENNLNSSEVKSLIIRKIKNDLLNATPPLYLKKSSSSIKNNNLQILPELKNYHSNNISDSELKKVERENLPRLTIESFFNDINFGNSLYGMGLENKIPLVKKKIIKGKLFNFIIQNLKNLKLFLNKNFKCFF